MVVPGGAPTNDSPPAISTLPLRNAVAVAKSRAVFITGVEVAGAKVLVFGS
jgi:hypothetical protein